MTSPKARHLSVRLLQASLLLFILSSLSGCVYLRLLKFKNQLRDFDDNIVVERSHGLSLGMKHPVLRDDDFTFITESDPTRIHSLSLSPKIEEWEWAFEKKSQTDADTPFTITFRTRFEQGLLTRIEFDPQLFEAIPEDFIIELFRSLGSARINQIRRSATASMNKDSLEDVPLPSLDTISHVMGNPTESQKERENDRRLWRYVFNFYNPRNRDLSGQFNITFKADSEDLAKEISGFEVTGKAR